MEFLGDVYFKKKLIIVDPSFKKKIGNKISQSILINNPKQGKWSCFRKTTPNEHTEYIFTHETIRRDHILSEIIENPLKNMIKIQSGKFGIFHKSNLKFHSENLKDVYYEYKIYKNGVIFQAGISTDLIKIRIFKYAGQVVKICIIIIH